LRLALLELVQISPDGQVSKRRAVRLRLPPRSAPAIDALISARLLVVDGDFIEPAHESLFGAWEHLASWVEDARSALMVRAEAQIDSELWARARQDPEYLWGAARLERALSLIQTSGVALGSGAESFLEASKGAVELCRKNEENRRNQEISRLRKQRRTVASVASIALVAAGIAFVFFLRARQAQMQIANSLRDSLLQTARAACIDVASGSRDIGLQALRKAAQIGPGEDLRSAYVNCLEHPSLRDLSGNQELRITTGKPPEVELVHIDGGVKATLIPSGADNTFEIQTESGGKVLAKWHLAANSVDSIRVSPHGTLVAVVDYDFAFEHQNLDLFDAHSGKHLSSLPAQDSSLGHMSPSPHRISFDAAGRYVALAGIGGSVFAWDLLSDRGPTPSLRARPFAAESLSIAISPDGRWVVAVDESANIVVLEMETNQVVARTSIESRLIESAPGGARTLGLEWTKNERIKLGPLQWQWLEPADQGFWVTANIPSQRAIKDLVFDTNGAHLAVGSEYGGTPYIATLSGVGLDVSHSRFTSDFPESIERVVFAARSDVCAAGLTTVFCMDIKGESREKISAYDFRRDNRQLTYKQGELIVAGERNSTLFRVFDTKGSKIWQRKFDLASLGPPEMLIDEPGQRIAYSGLDTSTAFSTIRLRDGEPGNSFHVDDGNHVLRMVLLHGSLALLSSADVSLRRFADGTPLRGPLEQAKPDRSELTFRTSDYLVAGRSRTGTISVWNLETRSKCSIVGVVSPRNKADALSPTAQRYVAFDGDFLKIWSTTNCKVVAVVGVVDAEDLAITPDGTELRYRTSQGKLITQNLRTRRKSEVAFELIQNCIVHVGSGWNNNATTFWDACLTSAGTVAVRAWNASNGTTKFDLKIPSAGNESVALDTDLERVVVASGVTEAGLWTWSLQPTSKGVSELCKSAPMASAGRDLRIVEQGKKAAWVVAPEKDQVMLDTMTLSSCEVRSAKLTSRVEITGGTPSGAVIAISGDSVQAIAPDGKVQWKAFGGFGRISHAALSADGGWIGASLDNGTVLLGRIGEAQPRLRLRGGPGDVTTVDIAPDGSWFAAGTADGRVNLWAIKQMEAELAAAGLRPIVKQVK
jgi:WD40 repeat protein